MEIYNILEFQVLQLKDFNVLKNQGLMSQSAWKIMKFPIIAKIILQMEFPFVQMISLDIAIGCNQYH
jgi:hypothetical protein